MRGELTERRAEAVSGYSLDVLLLVQCLYQGVRPDLLKSRVQILNSFVDKLAEASSRSSDEPTGEFLADPAAFRTVLEQLAYLAWKPRLEQRPATLTLDDFSKVIGDLAAAARHRLLSGTHPEADVGRVAGRLRAELVEKHHLLREVPSRQAGPAPEPEFVFTHDLIESFLCGCALLRQPNFLTTVVQMCDEGLPMDPVGFAIEYITSIRGEIDRAISVLAAVQVRINQDHSRRTRRLWLAAEIANAIGVGTLANDGVGARLLQTITGPLSKILTEGRLNPSERARVGRILARLGDPRPEVGVQNGIPNIDWAEVASGSFSSATAAGEGDKSDIADHLAQLDWKEKSLPRFYISRYPITYTQYQAFLAEVRQNTVPKAIWEGLSISPNEVVDQQRYRYGNHPCDSVSWREAKAFCNWLGYKLGVAVDLPSADQWEKAARGDQGKTAFPFGDNFDSSKANTLESQIGQTTPVGMYPGGVSPEGVHDMAGNVFEWCRDGLANGEEMFTRGGSWNHTAVRNRITLVASKKRPYEHHPYLGFRVVTKHPRLPTTPTVAIVGAGAAGTITAIRLIRHSRGPLHLILIDRYEDRVGGGVAYSRATADWAFMLNIQAGRISVYRERRFDFVEWINEQADRSQWPIRWDKRYNPSDAVPRRSYQQYLTDRLNAEVNEANERVFLDRSYIGYVQDIFEPDQGQKLRLTLRTEDGDKSLDADHVVLATGHVETRLPPALRPFKAYPSPQCILDLYPEKSLQLLKNLPATAKILVIGSGLRSFDVLSLLLQPCEDQRGQKARPPHVGEIHLISRKAQRHKSYPAEHVHEVISIPVPPALATLKNVPNTHDGFRDVILRAYRETEEFVKKIHPNIHEDVLPERILKAAEKLIVEHIPCIPHTILPDLLREAESVITVSRVGVVHEIGRLFTHKLVRSMAGNVVAVNRVAGGHPERLEVQWTDEEGKQGSDVYDAVVCCLGREAEFGKLTDELWKSLLQKRKAEPEPKTGRGVHVGHSGELISNDQRNDRITAVGLPREGDEFVRHGRTGAFAFALGPIKNQAFVSALHILRMVGDYGDPLPGFQYYLAHQNEALRSPGECVAEAVMAANQSRGGGSDNRALKWKALITNHINANFEGYAVAVHRHMEFPHNPEISHGQDIGAKLRAELIRELAPTEVVSLAVAHLIAQLEEKAMRSLTDIGNVDTGSFTN